MAPPPLGHKSRNYRRHPPATGVCSADDSDTPGIGRDSEAGGGHGEFPVAAAAAATAVNLSRRDDAAASGLQLTSSRELGGSEHGAFFDAFDAAAADDGGGPGEKRGGEDEIEETAQVVRRKSPSTASTYCSGDGAAGRDASTSRSRGTRHGADKRIASGFGYNMLKSMGWRDDTGLGKSSNGVLDPILPKEKPNHLGLGFNMAAAHDAELKKIRQIQEAKREERDRKLRLKVEEAERAEEEAMFMRESSIAMQNLEFESDLRAQGLFSDEQVQRPSVPAQGLKKAAEAGRCPHCGRLFDTKVALKSHVNARHAKLQHEAAKNKKLRKERRQRGDGASAKAGRSSTGKRKSSARSLAPMAQDFSVYD